MHSKKLSSRLISIEKPAAADVVSLLLLRTTLLIGASACVLYLVQYLILINGNGKNCHVYGNLVSSCF